MFIVFSIIDYSYIRSPESFNSITSGVESVLVVSMCIYYFYEQLKSPNTYLIYSSINFWIIISFLIFLSGTFFLYLMAGNLMNDRTFLKQYIIINSSFNILKNILLCIAMKMKTDEKMEPFIPDEKLNADWNSIHSLNHLN
jgi:ABC-type Fe3+-siderophore transport system permease subunit